MKVQVTLTRTDTGANAKIKLDTGEANKDYASWESTLEEAEQLGLINAAEALAVKLLPPGLPFHANREIDPTMLAGQGFISGKP